MRMEERVSHFERSEIERRMCATHNIELKWTRKSISDGLVWWRWDTLNALDFDIFFLSTMRAAATVGSYAHPPRPIFCLSGRKIATFFCGTSMCSRRRVKLKMEMYRAFGVRQCGNNWRNDLTNVPAVCAMSTEGRSGNAKCKLEMKFHLVACRCPPNIYIIFLGCGICMLREWVLAEHGFLMRFWMGRPNDGLPSSFNIKSYFPSPNADSYALLHSTCAFVL